jgi:hypothetical protein
VERFARSLYDYSQEHQWVRLLGWTDDELLSVPIHSDATSHAQTSPEDDYLNLANFGATGLGVSSQGSGGGTSANVHSLENVYVYRSDTPPALYNRLQRLMDQGGPIPYAPGDFEQQRRRSAGGKPE